MSPFAVSLAAPHERMAAYRLLFPPSCAGDLEGGSPADPDASGLVVARRADGRLCAAALVHVLSGSLGLAWPPRGDCTGAEDAVVAAACDWLKARGVKVCQAFAEADEPGAASSLVRNGFRHITRLVSMRRAVVPESTAPPRSLVFRRATPPFPDEFRSALLATQDGTLDCPELSAGRTADELLAGLTEPAPGTAWHFAIGGGKPVGVVILADGAEPGAMEVSYLGVVPGARGRGVGGELVRLALDEAVFSRAMTLALSTDARNEPALRLYRRHGFVETGCREVLLARWAAEPLRPA